MENAFISTKCAQTMRKEGVPPSPKIYTTAITACSRTADWKRALLLLVEMRKAFPSRSLYTASTPSDKYSGEANSTLSSEGVAKVKAVEGGRKCETPQFLTGVKNPPDIPVLPPSEVANNKAKSNDYQRQVDGVPDWWGRGNVHQVFGFGAATAVASQAAAKADGRRRYLKESRPFSDYQPLARGDEERGRWEGAGEGGDEKKSREVLDTRRAAYNAAINVCGRAGRWDRALGLLEVGFPLPSGGFSEALGFKWV